MNFRFILRNVGHRLIECANRDESPDVLAQTRALECPPQPVVSIQAHEDGTVFVRAGNRALTLVVGASCKHCGERGSR